MINFRYHIVSLIAVFLALGLGVLFGSSFIAQNTVKVLERSQDRLGDRNKGLRGQVVNLQERNSGLEGFVEATRSLIVKDALKDRPVIVLSFEGTSDEVLEDVVSTLALSGAKVDALLEVSSNFDMSSAERRQQVSLALELSGAASELQGQAASRFAETLSGKPSGILQRLADSDLVKPREAAGVTSRPLTNLPAPGSAFVVLPGQPNKGLDDGFLIPVLRSMSSAGAVLCVAEGGVKPAVIAKLREENGLKIVTVDSVESPAGQTALVLGLRAALAGTYGHYGFGSGTTSVLPSQGG